MDKQYDKNGLTGSVNITAVDNNFKYFLDMIENVPLKSSKRCIGKGWITEFLLPHFLPLSGSSLDPLQHLYCLFDLSTNIINLLKSLRYIQPNRYYRYSHTLNDGA